MVVPIRRWKENLRCPIWYFRCSLFNFSFSFVLPLLHTYRFGRQSHQCPHMLFSVHFGLTMFIYRLEKLLMHGMYGVCGTGTDTSFAVFQIYSKERTRKDHVQITSHVVFFYRQHLCICCGFFGYLFFDNTQCAIFKSLLQFFSVLYDKIEMGEAKFLRNSLISCFQQTKFSFYFSLLPSNSSFERWKSKPFSSLSVISHYSIGTTSSTYCGLYCTNN